MRKAVVIGMGKSGKAAYIFLKAKHYAVEGVEDKPELVTQLQKEGFVCNQQADLASADLVVVSPGVPSSHPLYQEAVKLGKKVIGEAELALQECKQKVIAVTGTNGKTTVTLLIEHVLLYSGKKAKALGNVGYPLTDYFLSPDPEEMIVAEMSSYQLEKMTSKVFTGGVILNITPDHLDRHGSMEAYAAAKCRLQDCMVEEGSFYVNTQVLEEFGHLLKPGFLTYGSAPSAFFWTDKSVLKQLERVEAILPSSYAEGGMHDSENVLAAWIVCRSLGVSAEQFIEALSTFKKPPHRVEFVANIEGVHYYDDSKGTNVDATLRALDAVKGPVVLIAGGVDKGASYLVWKKKFEGRVKAIFAIGQAAPKIEAELGSYFPLKVLGSLEEAVKEAKRCAKKGDVVLLSPGCSSFDMFRDYAHRGDEFKRFVTTRD